MKKSTRSIGVFLREIGLESHCHPTFVSQCRRTRVGPAGGGDELQLILSDCQGGAIIICPWTQERHGTK